MLVELEDVERQEKLVSRIEVGELGAEKAGTYVEVLRDASDVLAEALLKVGSKITPEEAKIIDVEESAGRCTPAISLIVHIKYRISPVTI